MLILHPLLQTSFCESHFIVRMNRDPSKQHLVGKLNNTFRYFGSYVPLLPSYSYSCVLYVHSFCTHFMFIALSLLILNSLFALRLVLFYLFIFIYFIYKIILSYIASTKYYYFCNFLSYEIVVNLSYLFQNYYIYLSSLTLRYFTLKYVNFNC